MKSDPGSSGMTTQKVLIIDDEELICQLIKTYLDDFEYEVTTAPNGEVGLELFDKEDFALVITDLFMPGISGQDVIKKIMRISPNTPTIVASGAGKVSDAIDATKAGAWDYVTKPIEDLDILRLTVERVLEKSLLLKENQEYKENLENLVILKTRDLEKTIGELNESRESLKLILNSICDLIFVTNTEGKITKINPAVKKFLLKKEQEIVGQNIQTVLFPQGTKQYDFTNTLNYLELADSVTIPEITITTPEGPQKVSGTASAIEENEYGEHGGMVVVLSFRN